MIDFDKIELLAPAGDFMCAKAAIDNGADAIYMGGEKFGARAFAKSVTDGSVIDAISYTHKYNKKFYLTVNTLFKEKELKEIFLYLDPLVNAGVDAFIVQDLGISTLLKEKYKNVKLHASTQMTITSSKGANLVKKLGFSQVVLSRELSIKEIKNIKKEIGDEILLETFIHGSMCYCYSGACYMSSFIGGESGNRGRCKGPCRLQYNSNSIKNKKEIYLLSMKDMCAINELASLIKAGVISFKIEGRMRKPEYVEGVVKIYRKYIDLIIQNINDERNENLLNDGMQKNVENDKKYLLSLYNKGGFTNYYDKHNGYDMIQRFER